VRTHSELVSFIWSVADLLRGDYKQADYGKVILPFTVLRRMDCVLAPTKSKVLEKAKELKASRVKDPELILRRITKVGFFNTSKLDLERVVADSTHVADNLRHYADAFSIDAADILEKFAFAAQVEKLASSNILYLVAKKFTEIDLHPETVPNHVMGTVFEELIRRFSEQSNETAGEHFTPREVIRLMVDLLFMEEKATLTGKAAIRSLYDPACGTGGMLSVAEEYLRDLNASVRLEVFGQELNDESYAICKADMLIKGQDASHIARGNSFSQDGHAGKRFDYLISNPPFGVEWKKVESVVREEADGQGYRGRFGAGLPRINDGSLLFLQHMIAKMKPPKEDGSRIAIVFNGSPLFTGDAGSGESEIRRWVLENDWLEAIVALPDQLFYNTGINTYVWILDNTKDKLRKGKVQLVNGVSFSHKMRKSLGNKRNQLSQDDILAIATLYGDFVENENSKIFDVIDFGYRRVSVERPLRLNFQASPERIARLENERAWKALAAPSKKKGATEGAGLQASVLAIVAKLPTDTIWKSRDAFEKALDAALAGQARKGARASGQSQVRLPAPIRTAILSALSERDESAEPCRDASGALEPDPDLRDTENIPLKEDVKAYFEREVLPHVPDAWIDESKTKVGYEIPFTRHFHVAAPMRPLEEIETEIRKTEGEIQAMLREVMG